jgi:ATP-binding cassette subfamily B protein
MKKIKKFIQDLLSLFEIILKGQAELKKIIFMTCIVAFFELLSVVYLIPYLKIFSSPVLTLEKWDLKNHIYFLNPDNFILYSTILFIFILVASAFFRLLLLQMVMKLTFSIGSKMSTEIFLKVINQKFEYFSSNNSSKLIDALTTKTNNVVYLAVMPFINLISSLIILFTFFVVLLLYFPLITIATLVILGYAYYFSIKLNSKKVTEISNKLAYDSEKSIKITQETFGNIKEIIINGYQNYAVNEFHKNEISLRKSQAVHSVITLSPKIIIEFLGFMFIVLFAFYYSTVSSIESFVPTLAALAFTAQKILPLMQQSYASWTSLKGVEVTVREMNSLLNLHVENEVNNLIKINFNSHILLNNIHYNYSNGKILFNNFYIKIDKNEKICIFGESGSGKSTLINLIMGLLTPVAGEVLVDDNRLNSLTIDSWRKKIAHVSQNIFIADESILNNITLGVPGPIDILKINEIINFVELRSYINSLVMGLDSNLGEGGAKLSGGQKQKIGIARALYRNSDVLILDESTNSLDPLSEENILKKLSSIQDKTIILITHKIENQKYFNKVLNISSMTK